MRIAHKDESVRVGLLCVTTATLLAVTVGSACSTGAPADPFGDSSFRPGARSEEQADGEGTPESGISATDAVDVGDSNEDTTTASDSMEPQGDAAPDAASGDEQGAEPGPGEEPEPGEEPGATAAPSQCGDGVRNGPGEACDGADLGGMACADVGEFTGGVLRCSGDCAFDVAGCISGSSNTIQLCSSSESVIPDGASMVPTTFTVQGGGTVRDVRLRVELVHSELGDLTIELSHGGRTVELYREACRFREDLAVRFRDDAVSLECNDTFSAHDVQPASPLSAFAGMDASGPWSVEIRDSVLRDTGRLLETCLEVER